MRRVDILRSQRLAGQVERYHTWPVIRRQSVAEHSWQVMRVWVQIYGDLRADVANYILWHDVGELVTGDLPFPIKRNSSTLKEIMDDLEFKARDEMRVPYTNIMESDRNRVRICDLVEMYEFGVYELMMGNTFGGPIMTDTRDEINKMVEYLPEKEKVKDHMYTVSRHLLRSKL